MIFQCEYFSLTEAELKKFVGAYPLVDVMEELKAMDMWLFSNPKKRYTKWRQFVNNWLRNAKPSNFKMAETRIAKEKADYDKKYKTVPEEGYVKPEDIAKITKRLEQKMRME